MGTRGLTVVINNGETKVAQYGQWDHNPSCQGVTILDFLRKYSHKAFKKRLASCRFVEQAELDEFYKEIKLEGDYMNEEQAKLYKEKYPLFTRDLGGGILEAIHKSTGESLLINKIEFAGDSLFCEYAYVIDFDKNTFEIYKGFNKRRLGKKQRFAQYFEKIERRGDDQYYPVSHLKTYLLTELPTESEFLEDCEPKNE
jgi:hypothetical protein